MTALLLRDYPANLVLLIGLIAGVTLVGYAARVARDFYHRSACLEWEKGSRR